MVLHNGTAAPLSAPVERYYDSHPTEKDLMGESKLQDRLLYYLVQVLEWYYREAGWYIARNLNIYTTRDQMEVPLAPDIAVFVSVRAADVPDDLLSWQLHLPDRPAPAVVLEVVSKSTRRADVDAAAKPQQYGRLGVQEYFAYDPRSFKRRIPVRLRGWRYDAAGQPQELVPDARGWLWSDALDSWLVPDEAYLHLYDTTGQRRLTEVEYRRQAEATERAAKEAERTAKERAYAKLRELGIDPETLE